jgi:hypothetical protein
MRNTAWYFSSVLGKPSPTRKRIIFFGNKKRQRRFFPLGKSDRFVFLTILYAIFH